MPKLFHVIPVWVSINLCFLAYQSLEAQSLDIASIDQEFRKAPAVIINEVQEVIADNAGKFILKRKLLATIFRREASDLAVLNVGYSSAIKVKSISGNVYDGQGKQIYKAKNSDISDYSNFNSFSVFEDNRVKVLDLKQVNYPYTVEFEYEIEFPNLYYIPNWTPQDYSKVPVVKAVAVYNFSIQNKLRFFPKNIPEDIVSEKLNGDRIIKTWEISNLQAYEPEAMVPVNSSESMILFVSPSEFVYDGFKGDLSSWESMGKWFYKLNEGKKKLSEATKKDVSELVRGAKSEEEKIKLLYEYLQGKTRYVSIQLGIGGLMPFDALFVDKNGYGDCKALSNYMGALLEEAGIKSHYALIYAGNNKRQIFPEFPADYFNHVILSVPLEKDTLWLECTSQTNPFGYLGRFTSDRGTLLVTENGGKLVKTPKYQQSENIQKLTAHFVVSEKGSAKGNILLNAKGLQTENANMLQIHRGSSEDKKKWILQNLKLPGFEILDYNFQFQNERIPEVTLNASVDIRNFVSMSGNRLFLKPNQLNVYKGGVIPANKVRKEKFEREMGFMDYDVLKFEIPQGFEIESMPQNFSIVTEFGSYDSTYEWVEGLLIYTRSLEMKDGVFEAEFFENYRNFTVQIEKADNSKVIFKKSF